MSTKRFMKRDCGFTLIELMIVVIVVSILAAIALPSYQESVRKSRRADAKSALVQLAQFMERNYSLAQRYDKDSAGVDIALPFTQAPVDNPTKYYGLALSAVAQNTFTLTATPIAGTSQASDSCLNLTITTQAREEQVAPEQIAGRFLNRTMWWLINFPNAAWAPHQNQGL